MKIDIDESQWKITFPYPPKPCAILVTCTCGAVEYGDWRGAEYLIGVLLDVTDCSHVCELTLEERVAALEARL